MQELAEIEEQLWGYIDGSCGEAERERMEKNIETDTAWRSTYQKLLSIHQQLQGITPEQPSMRFTKNLMERLEHVSIAPKITHYVNVNVIKAALVCSTALLVIFFTYIIATTEWSTQVATYEFLDRLSITKINVATVMYSTLFTIVILLLVLIDISLRRNRQKQAGL